MSRGIVSGHLHFYDFPFLRSRKKENKLIGDHVKQISEYLAQVYCSVQLMDIHYVRVLFVRVSIVLYQVSGETFRFPVGGIVVCGKEVALPFPLALRTFFYDFGFDNCILLHDVYTLGACVKVGFNFLLHDSCITLIRNALLLCLFCINRSYT